MDRTEVRRAIVGASIGNFVEWYDFCLYGIFATVFATLFFPEGDRVAALLLTLGIFGVAFAARPVGALFFGSYGDRHGRRNTLAIVVAVAFYPIGAAVLTLIAALVMVETAREPLRDV